MDYALQPHLYRNVPVYLWPWVWWQLFQIECWIKQTGRMVLGGVARDGKVYVLHVADDPNEIKPWSPRDMARYRTRHDVWLRGLSPCGEVGFNPALRRFAPRGEAGSGLAAPAHEPGSGLCPRLNPLSQTYNPTRHGDQLLLAMHLLGWLPLMNTLAGCNTPSRIAPTPLAQPPPLSPPALSPSGTRGKQVPVWLRQPMNQAQGCAPTMTTGPVAAEPSARFM